jgi:hypothetical protein
LRGSASVASLVEHTRALVFVSYNQLTDAGAFEAVFSPRGKDGKPMPLFDRATGTVDPVVAKAWEKYDIRMRLEKNWATLGPKLKGKVNVWMGEVDTFYLDGAARLLKESQSRLEGGAVVDMFPKKTHALLDRELTNRMKKEMKAALSKSE